MDAEGLRSLQKKSTKSTGPKRLKEAKPKARTAKQTGIDVQAILKSGSKDNVTNQTVALMTTEEAKTLTTTAGVTMLKEAKKGLRVQAFKVVVQFHTYHINYPSSHSIAL